MNVEEGLGAALLSPAVLLTFIACAIIAGVIIWLLVKVHQRRSERLLAQQRKNQEATVERLLDSVAQDKEDVVAEYEERLRKAQQRIADLEYEVQRMRDRMSSSGILGMFGGKQRDVVSALLLENEQLHELLAEKQEELRDLMSEMTTKVLERMDQQTRDNARAIRYKQALLSAFLQQDEARQLLDRLVAEGRIRPQAAAEIPASDGDAPSESPAASVSEPGQEQTAQ